MIDPGDKKRIKELFTEHLDLIENREEATKQLNDIKKEAAIILDVKPPTITKLFRYLRKLLQEGSDEIGELKELIDEIQD